MKYKISYLYMECLRGNKKFSTKQRLNYHLNHNVCVRSTNDCQKRGKISMRGPIGPHECNPHLCVLCKKLFSTKQKLDQHILNKTCLKDHNYECAFCQKVLSSKRRYLGHIKICKLKKKEMDDFIYFGHHPTEDELISLLRRRKAINKLLPGFELKERAMWSDIDHWEQICDRCGTKRGEQHIQMCLIPQHL